MTRLVTRYLAANTLDFSAVDGAHAPNKMRYSAEMDEPGLPEGKQERFCSEAVKTMRRKYQTRIRLRRLWAWVLLTTIQDITQTS